MQKQQKILDQNKKFSHNNNTKLPQHEIYLMPNNQDLIISKKITKKQTHSCSQSDEFELEYHQIKKLGLQVNKKKLRVGNWTPQENLVYLRFLIDNRSDFISQQQRRKRKVFYRLSKILKKRTPDQCRSHHQKLQMKYDDNIGEIIRNTQIKLSEKNFLLVQNIEKKEDLSRQKTRNTQTIVQLQGKQGQIYVCEQFYKLIKEKQNQFSLQIFIDHIKLWH